MTKFVILLATATGLSACAMGEPQPIRSDAMQQKYNQLLAGKTPGPTDSCLPLHRTHDMTVIDEQTLLFRDGRTVWVNNMKASCTGLNRVGHAIVNNTFGAQLCSGDIARVVDTNTGITVGSCAYGDFMSYRPAG